MTEQAAFQKSASERAFSPCFFGAIGPVLNGEGSFRRARRAERVPFRVGSELSRRAAASRAPSPPGRLLRERLRRRLKFSTAAAWRAWIRDALS
jgi:hypothetical protein